MTIEELKKLADDTMKASIETLRETGGLNQKFFLFHPDGGYDVMFLDGSVSNSEPAKSALAKQIRERVAVGEVAAIVMVSDTYFARGISKEALALKDMLRMNVEQAHAAGLCDMHEGISLLVDSPIYSMRMTQEYKRVPEGGKTIELVGEPERDENPAGLQGRFIFFRAAREAAGKGKAS